MRRNGGRQRRCSAGAQGKRLGVRYSRVARRPRAHYWENGAGRRITVIYKINYICIIDSFYHEHLEQD